MNQMEVVVRAEEAGLRLDSAVSKLNEKISRTMARRAH